MNKNQKKTPYTYSQLIFGNLVVTAFHRRTISDLTAKMNKFKRQNKPVPEEVTEGLAYHRKQVEYFKDELERFSLARRACGDATVLVR